MGDFSFGQTHGVVIVLISKAIQIIHHFLNMSLAAAAATVGQPLCKTNKLASFVLEASGAPVRAPIGSHMESVFGELLTNAAAIETRRASPIN